jgi:hypothetical protein
MEIKKDKSKNNFFGKSRFKNRINTHKFGPFFDNFELLSV